MLLLLHVEQVKPNVHPTIREWQAVQDYRAAREEFARTGIIWVPAPERDGDK